MLNPIINIDMDRRCTQCGKPGATGSGLCLDCGLPVALDSIKEKEMKAEHKEVREEQQADRKTLEASIEATASTIRQQGR